MGRNGRWFSSIKKTLSPSSKEKKSQKLEKKGLAEENPSIPETSVVENVGGSYDSHPIPLPEEVKPVEVEDELPKSASSVAVATGGATVSSTTSTAKMAEEAAIRIQTAFRGYLARRVLWDMRGLVRLKAVVEGPSVKQQTANTLKYTQNASHVQSQINSRRVRMSEENQALQRQLLLKRAKELANLQNGDDWNDSVQSKEQMEAKLLSKYEAMMRRERAMAYSFSHQQPWKKSAGPPNLLFMDPTNPQWGWSWSERNMAARPWEARAEKDPGNDHPSSVKTGITITRNEIAKSYARHQLNSAPSTPRSKAGGPLASRKSKASPSPQAFVSGVEANLDDDDSQSVVSVRSERNRRHSVAGPIVKNDEAGSPAARKRVVAAKSAKAKPREKGMSENGGGSTTVAAAALGGRAKKQLGFPGSPAKPRRHSGPPKVETTISNELE